MPGRDPRLRPHVRHSALRAVAAFVVVAGALVAPATVASAVGGDAGVRCPRGTESAVIDAYAAVFSRATQLTADERAARLARGDDPAVRALLDAWLAEPAGASTTVTVNGVACRTRARAVVDADLVLAGTVLPEVLPTGRAVRDAGAWKVATKTFCVRMRLENPALGGSGICAR